MCPLTLGARQHRHRYEAQAEVPPSHLSRGSSRGPTGSQGIAAAAGVSAGCPGPDDLAALEERAAGWKFVAAWACCFRGVCRPRRVTPARRSTLTPTSAVDVPLSAPARGMAGLQPTLETLEYAVAHSVPWVLHYDVLDAEQAKGLRCHCIQVRAASLS